MKSGRKKIIFRVAVAMATIMAAAVVGVVYYVRHYIPANLRKDFVAAIAAKNVADPDARLKKYMEGRFGTLDDATNREQAFKGFFDIDHIKAMQLLVQHSPVARRRDNIEAMSRWITTYRDSMSPEEKAALGDYFQSADGQAAVHLATAQYMAADAEYRSATAPVIAELLTTLTAVEK